MATSEEVNEFVGWLSKQFSLGYHDAWKDEYGRRRANVALYVQLNYENDRQFTCMEVSVRIYAFDVWGSVTRDYRLATRNGLDKEYVEKCIAMADSMDDKIVQLDDEFKQMAETARNS